MDKFLKQKIIAILGYEPEDFGNLQLEEVCRICNQLQMTADKLAVEVGVLNKNQKPSKTIDGEPVKRIEFEKAIQYVQPSEYYTPCLKLKGYTLDDLSSDFEELGTKDVGYSILHLSRSKRIPSLYEFCSEQKYNTYVHEAGYRWSSRPSVINKEFGTKLMTVIIHNRTCAMAVDEVSKIIPEGYEIVEVERHGEFSYEMKAK